MLDVQFPEEDEVHTEQRQCWKFHYQRRMTWVKMNLTATLIMMRSLLIVMMGTVVLLVQHTGPSLDISDKSPLDVFKLFVTDEMLDDIFERTCLHSTIPWCNHPSTTPLCSNSIVKQDRFSLLKVLHLNENSMSRKACLVTPFLNPLIKNCQKAYHPSCEWSSDESMIGFKDRLSFIQYLLKKPTKWGMKVFGLRQTAGIGTHTTGGCTQGSEKRVHFAF